MLVCPRLALLTSVLQHVSNLIQNGLQNAADSGVKQQGLDVACMREMSSLQWTPGVSHKQHRLTCRLICSSAFPAAVMSSGQQRQRSRGWSHHFEIRSHSATQHVALQTSHPDSFSLRSAEELLPGAAQIAQHLCYR